VRNIFVTPMPRMMSIITIMKMMEETP
jgi:hypothetical protein